MREQQRPSVVYFGLLLSRVLQYFIYNSMFEWVSDGVGTGTLG